MRKRRAVQGGDPAGDSRKGVDRPGSSASRLLRYGQGAALVFEFTGTIVAGVVVGYALDRYVGTEPLFLIVATLVAVVGGFIRLVKVVRRLERPRP